MKDWAAVAIFAICIGANVYLMMNNKEPIEMLWLGAFIAFIAAL